MRIDDENKVVYVDEPLFDELTKLKEGIGIVGIVSLFQILWEHQNDYPEIQKFLWSHEKDIWTNDEEPFLEDDKYNQVLMVKIWSDEYQFKLEQPQKYYWRKKNEHLAWFEEEIYLTRFKFSDNENFVYILGSKVGSLQMTEPEAFHLLQHDFDKFEKVECE